MNKQKIWYKYLRFLAGMMCAVLAAVCAGCGKEVSSPTVTKEPQAVQDTQLTAAAQKIKDAIDEKYNDGFLRTELSQRLSNKGGSNGHSGKNGDRNFYGRERYYIGELITDSNVASIEWQLHNCVGSFMEDSYHTSDLTVAEIIPTIESKPYLLVGNDQSEVFFTVYYYYDMDSSNNAQTKQIQDCIRHLRITADITFADGTKEMRNYGVGYISETSSKVSTMRLYLLE